MKQSNNFFNLKKMLNIYNKMFKGKYDESIFYQIVHYYNGKIVDKNELKNYFDVLNDNSFQLRPSYINDETIYKTKQNNYLMYLDFYQYKMMILLIILTVVSLKIVIFIFKNILF